MVLENVIEDIIVEAEKEAKQIISQGEQEAKKILDDAKTQAKDKVRAFEEETEKLAEDMSKIELSSLNIKLRRQLLEAKKDVIEALFSQVLEKIPKSEYAKLVERMLSKAEKELGGLGTVWCNDDDKGIVAKKGAKTRTLGTAGGIIAENKDGSMRVNYTFEVLLKDLKEETLNDVARQLFED